MKELVVELIVDTAWKTDVERFLPLSLLNMMKQLAKRYTRVSGLMHYVG